jgi:diguanylate cyclase (GGDEF)-like protein
MLWYVAIIAALNLCLGYFWAVRTRRCPMCAQRGVSDWSSTIGSAALAGMPRECDSNDRAGSGERAAATAEVAGKNAAGDDAEAAPLDPATGLVTREHAERLLAKYAEKAANGQLTVALVEVDANESADLIMDQALDQRLMCGVSNVVRQSLTADHTAARFAEEQLLLLVRDEDVDQATRRAEELRQRVANTEFVVDGHPIKTTVTCALAELSPDRSREQLLEFLQEALTEAKRYGGNRTFTHDGNSPSPVVPPELELEPQQLAI